MMGPVPDRSGGASGHRPHPEYVEIILPSGVDYAPVPPPNLDDDEREEWALLFGSGYALGPRAVWSRADWTLVYRLFAMRAEWRSMFWQAHADPVVAGSSAQDVLNPRGKYALELHKQIVKLEDQLALSPMARARLGVKVAVGQLAQAKKAQLEGRGPGEPPADGGTDRHYDV